MTTRLFFNSISAFWSCSSVQRHKLTLHSLVFKQFNSSEIGYPLKFQKQFAFIPIRKLIKNLMFSEFLFIGVATIFVANDLRDTIAFQMLTAFSNFLIHIVRSRCFLNKIQHHATFFRMRYCKSKRVVSGSRDINKSIISNIRIRQSRDYTRS